MKPYWSDDTVTLYAGDCRDVLAELADASVDAIVTDPPYELVNGHGRQDARGFRYGEGGKRTIEGNRGGFMGLTWDSTGVAFDPDMWAACLRVLRPGGHLLAFGGTRTYHRMTCAIEDAGFEIRDSIHWIYGSGFPKSLDVSKAIDRQRDDRADVLRVTAFVRAARDRAGMSNRDIDEAFGTNGMAGHWTSAASQPAVPTWEQWQKLRELLDCGDEIDAEVWRLNGRKGTPGEAWDQREVIGERRVPIGHAFAGATYGGDSSNKPVDVTAPATADAARWSGFGTALKPSHEPVVVARKPLDGTVAANVLTHGTGALNIDACRVGAGGGTRGATAGPQGAVYGDGLNGTFGKPVPGLGRWPANLALAHAPDCADGGPCADDCPVNDLDRQSGARRSSGIYGGDGHHRATGNEGIGFGGGHRPASMYDDQGAASRFYPTFRYEAKAPAGERPRGEDGTAHPTVKPVALMSWLVRLVCPPGGTVLDPFLGSGTTAEACVIEGFRCIGIERDAAHLPLIKARLSKPIQPTLGFGDAS